MRLDDDRLGFSPTDLANFSACGHRTLLDRLRVAGLARPRIFADPRLDLLRARGAAHERAYLEVLKSEGKRVVEIGPRVSEEVRAGEDAARAETSSAGEDARPAGEPRAAGYARRAHETRAAMADGADVIYQGTLYDGTWVGLVDFLRRVETPSDLGGWSYEVVDAKLARGAKAAALLQTCVYSELLERVQGAAPERVHLYLGGPTPRLASFRLAHFAAYYRALKRRFEKHAAVPRDEPPVAPDPVEHCQVCHWSTRCRAERVASDHLSLVAGIARDHRRALDAHGVSTLEGLARLPLHTPPDGLRRTGFRRIREQARVQLEGRVRGAPYHERLEPYAARDGAEDGAQDHAEDDAQDRVLTGAQNGAEDSAEAAMDQSANGGAAASREDPPLGLAALPAPHPHDLFFDIEGADYAYDAGLEYLFGVSDIGDGYRADWALTPDEEKAMLADFLDRTLALVHANPGAHVYHFGHYEPTALKRLVGRYGVGTAALDELLERRVFVDLHRVVKQSVRASVESYSIKALEAFYGFGRDVPLADANPARGRLELALALGLLDDEALEDRTVVEGYNRDDCVSTRALRDWLEGLRAEAIRDGHEIPRPGPPTLREKKPEDIAADQEMRELMDALLAGVPEVAADRSREEEVRWLAAYLLEWHRREDKSAWWDFFRLQELSEEELVEETKPLAGLEYEGVVGDEARSHIHRFRFPPQEHRLSEGGSGTDPVTEKSRRIHVLDEPAGIMDLKVGKTTEFDPRALRALLPDEIVQSRGQRARLRDTARLLLDGEPALEAWSPASVALLRCDPPTFAGGIPLTEVLPDRPLLERARAAALGLRPGVLPVQGPPGTGKTYSGARMIRALLRAGLRVGVTGPSHKVITNLLDAICKADLDDERTLVTGLQVGGKDAASCGDARFEQVEGSSDAPRAIDRRDKEGEPPFNLIAGTSWLWSTDRMLDRVDVLVIDEAGQVSLANALAIAPAAPRMILLGDPQQLNQPQKGIHPPGTEASVLEHLAGEDGILGEAQGLFLAETWRMRPEITAYTSELFYERRLHARGDLSRQRLGRPDGRELHGLHFVPVAHTGNSRESAEEAEQVVAIYRALLGGAAASAGQGRADGGEGTGDPARANRRATFTDRKGATRALRLKDLLVVAPYNAQVLRIQERLAAAGWPGAAVGTVDKFQGQEAPVAIYSLASSSAEDAPRGMGFLYALDRLNVATSRARCATLVVASPELLTAECRRPEQMRMVNAFVRFGELAAGGRTGP